MAKGSVHPALLPGLSFALRLDHLPGVSLIGSGHKDDPASGNLRWLKKAELQSSIIFASAIKQRKEPSFKLPRDIGQTFRMKLV